MKRLAILTVMLVLLASCTKSGYVSAKIDYTISSNTMTKVTTAQVQSVVADVIKGLPVKMGYGLEGGKVSVCDAGDVVSVPVGDVRVVLNYCDTYPVISDDVAFFHTPVIYADTLVNFHSYYSELIVKAHFECSMIVIDPSVVDCVYIGNEELVFEDYGDFRALYVYAEEPGLQTKVKVYAKENTDYESKEVAIKPSALDWGKWYLLTPKGITEADAELNYIIDGFEEGGVI